MKVEFLSQAGKLLKEQKQYRRRLIVFLCLAVIVTYGTLTALKLYGQAMTHRWKCWTANTKCMCIPMNVMRRTRRVIRVQSLSAVMPIM